VSQALNTIFTRVIRTDLHRHQCNLADATDRHDEVAQRRAEKGIALWTSKLLCPHACVQHKRLRVNGFDKHAYKCIACKAYTLSDKEL
jgi:hypothetical protein